MQCHGGHWGEILNALRTLAFALRRCLRLHFTEIVLEIIRLPDGSWWSTQVGGGSAGSRVSERKWGTACGGALLTVVMRAAANDGIAAWYLLAKHLSHIPHVRRRVHRSRHSARHRSS